MSPPPPRELSLFLRVFEGSGPENLSGFTSHRTLVFYTILARVYVCVFVRIIKKLTPFVLKLRNEFGRAHDTASSNKRAEIQLELVIIKRSVKQHGKIWETMLFFSVFFVLAPPLRNLDIRAFFYICLSHTTHTKNTSTNARVHDREKHSGIDKSTWRTENLFFLRNTTRWRKIEREIKPKFYRRRFVLRSTLIPPSSGSQLRKLTEWTQARVQLPTLVPPDRSDHPRVLEQPLLWLRSRGPRGKKLKLARHAR